MSNEQIDEAAGLREIDRARRCDLAELGARAMQTRMLSRFDSYINCLRKDEAEGNMAANEVLPLFEIVRDTLAKEPPILAAWDVIGKP